MDTKQGYPTGRPPKLTMPMVVAALRATGGIKRQAALRLQCDRETLRTFCRRNPEVEDVIAEIKEDVLDLAESCVMQAIASGDWKAAQYFLQCQGKHRGWSVRQEITGTDGGPVRVQTNTATGDLLLERLTELYGQAEIDRITRRLLAPLKGNAGNA